MEGFKGFNINNIVTDLEAKETTRTKLPTEDIREMDSKALNREMMDRNSALKALTGPEGVNMDNTN